MKGRKWRCRNEGRVPLPRGVLTGYATADNVVNGSTNSVDKARLACKVHVYVFKFHRVRSVWAQQR